jgi:hypothetical protein
MAVREFRDASGREWRAWDIKPEEIHPITRGEDYLADCFVTGWVVFETKAGDEKRRLCPWPIRWMDESELGLRRLLARAEVVPPYRVRAERASGADSLPARLPADLAAAEKDADVTDLDVVRTFRYPGGSYWTACVVPAESGDPPVLRFRSGSRAIDRHDWPKDWPDQPDDILIEMLRHAVPRAAASHADPAGPRRRWNDRVESTSPHDVSHARHGVNGQRS